MHLPVFRSLFSSNDNSLDQTDIVMLLTPHIVRTHELRQQDLNPIYIGTQQNLGLGGPPPLIANPSGQGAAAQPDAAAPGPLAAPRRPAAPAGDAAARNDPRHAGGAGRAAGRRRRLAPPAAPAPRAGAAAAQQAPAPSRRRRPPSPTPRRQAAGQLVITPPGSRVPRRRRSVHRAGLDLERAADVDAVGVDHLRPRRPARPRGAGRQLHAPGRRRGDLHAARWTTATGRVDITVARGQDLVGASGTGLRGGAASSSRSAPGRSTFAVSGAGTGPAGTLVTLRLVAGDGEREMTHRAHRRSCRLAAATPSSSCWSSRRSCRCSPRR